jgi:hypothetical protein
MVSIETPSFNIEPVDILFLNLKGYHPLHSIKLVSAFNDHKISFEYSNQHR